jgi:hypothetical protein
MNDLWITPMVAMVGALFLAIHTSRTRRWETGVLWLSWLAHVVSAVAMVLLTKYFFGGGDMIAYHREALVYADLLKTDSAYFSDIFLYSIGRNPQNPMLFLAGTSTGAMFGAGTFLSVLLGGSLYAICMAIAMLGLFSKYMIYKALAISLPERCHRVTLLVCMLLPSMVFWTSGLLKEALAMIGMGPLCLGSALLVQRKRFFLGGALILVGGFIISIYKSYILIPWLLVVGIWFYWQRTLASKGSIRLLSQPIYIALAFGLAFGGIVMLGEFFPRYSFARVTDEIAQLQSLGQRISGGSNYVIADAPARSAGAQLALLPVGLLFSLFRPLPFEARNFALLLNVAEMIVVLWLWWRLFRVRPLRQTLRALFTSPVLVASLVFVILFGAIVGIATTNIGTLSRYRIPMMPFYIMLLAVLGDPKLLAKPATAPTSRARRQRRRTRR